MDSSAEDMRILFLGGTGNISAECAALLHERGHEILVLSRGRNAVPAGYRAIVADRKDAAAMRAALKGVQPEVVINFLGYDLPDVQVDYELFNGVVRQYVFISSAVVYAKPPPRLPLTEDAPVGNAWWDYAQKKLACEQWLRQRHAGDRLPGDDRPPLAHLLEGGGFRTRSPAGATPLRRGWSRANRCSSTTTARACGR